MTHEPRRRSRSTLGTRAAVETARAATGDRRAIATAATRA